MTSGTGANNSFYNDLWPILEILRLKGLFPLKRNKDGDFSCRLLSAVSLYSLLLYFGLIYLLWNSYGDQLSSREFDQTVINVSYYAYFTILVCIPLTSWLDAPSFARYLTHWSRFQNKYCKVTGERFTLALKPLSFKLTLLIPVYVISVEVLTQHLTGDEFRPGTAIVNCYINMTRYNLALFWYLLCSALKKTSANFLKNFQKNVRLGLNMDTVVAFRTLWWHLRKLSHDTGRAVCFTFVFYIAYLWSKTMFNTYTVLADMIFEVPEGYTFFYVAIISLGDYLLLFIICDQAHRFSLKMKEFRLFLLSVYMEISKNRTRQEVKVFLRLVENHNCNIDLGGFITVNRKLFVSLSTMMVTYMVVLLQFKLTAASNERTTS